MEMTQIRMTRFSNEMYEAGEQDSMDAAEISTDLQGNHQVEANTVRPLWVPRQRSKRFLKTQTHLLNGQLYKAYEMEPGYYKVQVHFPSIRFYANPGHTGYCSSGAKTSWGETSSCLGYSGKR